MSVNFLGNLIVAHMILMILAYAPDVDLLTTSPMAFQVGFEAGLGFRIWGLG